MSAVEQLALAQQIEFLQAQQNQLAATHQQYVNMGMLPQGQMQNFQVPQGQMNVSPHGNQFQFPGQMGGQQHLGVQMNSSAAQQTHRRNQSALPNVGNMGPPPAPSSQGKSFQGFPHLIASLYTCTCLYHDKVVKMLTLAAVEVVQLAAAMLDVIP